MGNYKSRPTQTCTGNYLISLKVIYGSIVVIDN